MNVKTTEIAQATTKSAWGLMKSQVRHGARSLIATFIRYPWAGTKSSSINASYWCSPWISFEFEKIKRKTSSRLSTPTLCFFITQTVPVCYVEPAKFFKSRTQFISNRRSCRWSLSWSAIFVSFWVLFSPLSVRCSFDYRARELFNYYAEVWKTKDFQKLDATMGVVFIFLAFVAIFAAILCFIKNYKKIQLDIPAPNALPIIGHAHLIIGLNNEGASLISLKRLSGRDWKLNWELNFLLVLIFF